MISLQISWKGILNIGILNWKIKAPICNNLDLEITPITDSSLQCGFGIITALLHMLDDNLAFISIFRFSERQKTHDLL